MFHLEFRYLWRLHWTTWVFVRWKGGFLRLRRINRRFFLLQCVVELCIFHNVKHAWNAKWHRHNIRNVLLILRTWLTIDLMTFSDTFYSCAQNDSIFFFFPLMLCGCIHAFNVYIVHCALLQWSFRKIFSRVDLSLSLCLIDHLWKFTAVPNLTTYQARVKYIGTYAV